MMAAASTFEFKYRFWIFSALFGTAFSSYVIDHKPAGVALAEGIARLRGTAATNIDYHLVFSMGALFCVAAALLRTWGTAYLNSEVMVGMRLDTSRLVADGPYRYVRNPLYFGNILLAIGLGLLASRIGFIILVAGMILYDCRLILLEEAGIAAIQGERYRAYCSAVPRLLPALRTKVLSAGGVPNWGDGILGEAFMWTLAVSAIAFAVTLNQVIYFGVLASAFLVYGVCLAVIKLRRKRVVANVQHPNVVRVREHED
jgi:protein-S-isoprenylcysteine O-methyltransferase Ste14